jgi:hypothetical protein
MKTTPDQNKALVPEAFDTLFLVVGRAIRASIRPVLFGLKDLIRKL